MIVLTTRATEEDLNFGLFLLPGNHDRPDFVQEAFGDPIHDLGGWTLAGIDTSARDDHPVEPAVTLEREEPLELPELTLWLLPTPRQEPR